MFLIPAYLCWRLVFVDLLPMSFHIHFGSTFLLPSFESNRMWKSSLGILFLDCFPLGNNLGWLTCTRDDDHVCHVIGMFIGGDSPSLTRDGFDTLIAIDVNPIS